MFGKVIFGIFLAVVVLVAAPPPPRAVEAESAGGKECMLVVSWSCSLIIFRDI
jgi:hypothetical protein